MNITRYKPSDIIAVNGNSLTVFVDITDGILKAKDVRGNVYPLESLSSTLENAQAVFIDPNEDALKYLKDPQTIDRVNAKQLNLGWARYDDTQYTSSSKLTLNDQQTVTMPNNAGRIFRSYDGIDFYNPSTEKIIAESVNDTYLLTITFKASAANANSTHLDLSLSGGDYERISEAIAFYKANNTEQNFHRVYQYYSDEQFVLNGSTVTIESDGGASKIWDVIYFIQKTQSYTA